MSERKRPRPQAGATAIINRKSPAKNSAKNTNPEQTKSQAYMDIQLAAVELINLGFSVLPVNQDKTPACQWKQFQTTRMKPDDAPKYFHNGTQLAIVAGVVSGGLECLDIDDPALFTPFLASLKEHSPRLAGRLCQRKTPNGYHILYRCQEPVAGNQKLAMTADNKVEIETRGQGGYFLHAPSGGYAVIKNSLRDCPVLTADEVRAIHLVAGMFDKRAIRTDAPPLKSKPYGGGLRPGDAFNQEHNAGDVLEKYGWKHARRTTAGMGYTRPGKKNGVSGVLLETGNFYVWSSNASPLEAGRSYSPFALFSVFGHGGDFAAAARSLTTKGGGKSARVSDPERPEEWEKPISIQIPRLPSVTKEMMPKTLCDMIFAISANTETPVELALMMGLTVCATACQKKYVIESSPGYTEPLSLWGLAALESGNRKSSVEKKMVSPLRKWEAEARDSLAPVIKEATARRENELAVIKGLRNKLAKGGTDERDDLKNEILSLEQKLTEVPKPPQVWEQDITPEHLGTVMDANHECLGLFSSEGGIFDIIAGRYSKGVPNLDLFLQSHSGDPVRVSRGSRPPVNLLEPALSIGISPQPSVIRELSNGPGFRGRGLIARFMYVLPASPLGNRNLVNLPPVSTEVYARYSQAIQKLLNEDYPADGPTIIKMSSEAVRGWTKFSRAVEVNLRDGGQFEHVRDWAGKLPGLIARVAGVYHCIDPDGVTVSGCTMEMALRLADVLIAHALAAFDLMGVDEGMSGARKIFNWLRRNDLSTFSSRDCFEATKGTFKKTLVMEASLGVLKEHFIIRERRPPEKKPGRPKIIFEVNPGLNFKKQKSIRNIRKTSPEAPFCEYCEPFSDNENYKFPDEKTNSPDNDGWETIE